MSDTQHEVIRPPDPAAERPGAAGTARRSSGGFAEGARRAASYLAAGLFGGVIGGLLIGGVGTRLAMFVIRVTTGPEAIGVISDDQFKMGQLSGATFFLLLFGAAAGGAVGVLYLVSRVWIPERFRIAAFGILGGLVGGSAIVHADGIDFSFLQPAWLAVLMFVAIPAAGAAAIARMTEWRLKEEEGSEKKRPWFYFFPLVGLIPMGPVGLMVAGVTLAVVALNQKVPIARLWTTRPVAMVGLALLGVWSVFAAAALAKDLSGIF